MPGLVMLHEHMFYFSGFRVWHSQAVSYPRLYLAAGVTTLRTAGTDVPYTDLNLKLAIDEGRIAGPKMFVTGPFFNGYEGHFLGNNIVRTQADARRGVAYWAGATSMTGIAKYQTAPTNQFWQIGDRDLKTVQQVLNLSIALESTYEYGW